MTKLMLRSIDKRWEEGGGRRDRRGGAGSGERVFDPSNIDKTPFISI